MDQPAATPAVDVLVTALADQTPGVVVPVLLVRDRLAEAGEWADDLGDGQRDPRDGRPGGFQSDRWQEHQLVTGTARGARVTAVLPERRSGSRSVEHRRGLLVPTPQEIC
jgi:hypothetical protein